MAFNIKNFHDNNDVKIIAQKGCFSVLEWQKDLSVMPHEAMQAYFASEMNVKQRQVLCKMNGNKVILQSGAMAWMAGPIQQTSGVKGAGDLLGKAVRGKVTGETAVKPEYSGAGALVLEPTYKHIILEDIANWGGGVVLEDGLFLACDASLTQKAVARSTISSAALGGEGLFNLSLTGNEGIFVLESKFPRDELITIDLQNETLKIDGNMAIAWSPSLQFTVERSGKSLLGSAASGEGLVNVYRGTGRVLMAPFAK